MTYGALVDGTGIDLNTSLHHAARKDNVRFAVLLLDYNADINASNLSYHTPLTSAIMYNSYGVLELLLDHWEEFSTCPRLKGPHLIEITALYADVETVKLLTQTDHFKLKYDENYSLREFAKSLTERVDVTDELIAAFDELLLVLDHNPARPSSPKGDGELEKGLPDHHPSALATLYESEKLTADASLRSRQKYGCPYSDDSDEGEEFEDAVENAATPLVDVEARDSSRNESKGVCPAGFS